MHLNKHSKNQFIPDMGIIKLVINHQIEDLQKVSQEINQVVTHPINASLLTLLYYSQTIRIRTKIY